MDSPYEINCTNSNNNDKLNITVNLYQNKNATKDEICIKTDFRKITLVMYFCNVRQHNLSLFAFACSNSRCSNSGSSSSSNSSSALVEEVVVVVVVVVVVLP